jgi:hypothetical protein
MLIFERQLASIRSGAGFGKSAVRIRACWAVLPFVDGGLPGGDAVLSRDGQRIYAIASSDGKAALREIKLSNQTSGTIPLPQLPQNDALVGITRSEWDKIPLLTRKSVWAFDPRSGRTGKVRDAPKNENFWRIAYDPKSRQVFVTADDGLFLLKNGRELVSVNVRRHPGISCPVFTSSGEMFFAEDGDLWHGRIEVEDNHYSLSAYRYAPLAAPETAPTTPAETGVTDIAVARDTI